jgi:HD-like signal output (HDOD) protein
MSSRPILLFVDDEANILSGLRRMLFARRNDWDMRFANSGAEALAMMAETPVDIIISDMRMPGMDGADLLGHVKERHPQTLRFILSGFSDEESATRALVRSHQFLAKPCEGKMLENRIDRALALRHKLHQPELLSVIGRLDSVPVLPRVYVQLTEALDSGTVSDREIETIVASDPVLVARLLSVANSAYFGSTQRLTTPAQAIHFVGTNAVRFLALTCGLIGMMKHPVSGPLTAEDITSHAARSAAAVRLLTGWMGFDNRLIEESMVAGLLHDIGHLILMENMPGLYTDLPADMLEDGPRLCAWERAKIGASHAEIGAYLLAGWGLPQWIVEAADRHHTLDPHLDADCNPVVAVALAERIVSGRASPQEIARATGLPCVAALAALPDSDRLITALKETNIPA